jgi:uncharacterized membrane protein YbhN (UPF0104 family)
VPGSGTGAARPDGAVTRGAWAWLRALAGVAILAALAWRLGTGAFLDGLRVINGATLAAAAGIGLLTTVFSAWRWCLVARGLGIRLPLRGAVADYYRALFLNAALPGGILGDVHRAVRHGREVGDIGRGVRAVVLERFAGQVVLVTVGVAVLLAHPSPVLARAHLDGATSAPVLALALALVVAAGLATGLVARSRRRRATGPQRHAASPPERDCASPPERDSAAPPERDGAAPPRREGITSPGLAGATRWRRALRIGARDARRGLLTRGTGPWIVLASAIVLAGHLATFLVAARAAGSSAPFGRLVPLMLLALIAMALPINVGGWGPREGVCAWAFGAAGLSATLGLTTAVVYGLLAFVASLPGAGVLAVRWITRLRAGRRPTPAGRLDFSRQEGVING